MNIQAAELNKLYEAYPILKKINKKNNGALELNMMFKNMNAGDYMFSAASICNGIAFVVSGKIKIYRIRENGDETKLYDINSGELCHEALSCILNFKPLNIIGEASVHSNVCIIKVDAVKKYLLSDSEFLSYMYKDIYTKFSSIIEKREEKIHDSLKDRLIKWIVNKESKIIYATHNDIALEIDTKREVVSRTLKILEKEGYIAIKRGKLIILKDLKHLL